MTVVILQGVSGSGKSTFARSLGGVICSADDFFMQSGTYKFDLELLGEAHKFCFRKFMHALENPELRGAVIVVDNTNIRLWEMAPYVSLAHVFDREVEIHTFKVDPEVACQRGLHNVPLNVTKKKASGMENPLRNWGRHIIHELMV